MRIALTGNPNSGKTTMFNALTGRNERVGNWAGVTVDKKEAPIKKNFYEGAEELLFFGRFLFLLIFKWINLFEFLTTLD